MKQPTPEQIEETLRLWKEGETSPYNLDQEVMETALRFLQKAMGEPSAQCSDCGAMPLTDYNVDARVQANGCFAAMRDQMLREVSDV